MQKFIRNFIATVTERKYIGKSIHVSTDEVYGFLSEGGANETFPLKPNSTYAASKAASDLFARTYFVTHGLDVRTTRCCNNYGKYQYPEKIIPVFINKLKSRQAVPIYGDGKNVREWIHVSDHARAIQIVLENGKPGEIYNIGTGQHFSNNELASEIIRLMGFDESMKAYITDRQGHDFRYSVDLEKLKSLGFERKIKFNEGIETTIDWYVANSVWWDSYNEVK